MIKSILYTWNDWQVKIYAHGEIFITPNQLQCVTEESLTRCYEFDPSGDTYIEDVSTGDEYVWITMSDGTTMYQLKLEGDSCIVIDKMTPKGEDIEEYGAWDFIDDRDER